MKINYSYEQSENETEKQQETIKTIIGNILSFGEKVFGLIAADKVAARSNAQLDQLDRLSRAIENLSCKVDRIEAMQKFQHYDKK